MKKNFYPALVVALLVATSVYAGGASSFGPPQGGGGGGGGGLSNPLTEDLDVDDNDVLNVQSLSRDAGDLTIEALSGDVNVDSPNGRNVLLGTNTGGVTIGRSAGTTTVASDLTIASGKGITGGLLTWTSWTPTGSWSTNTTYAGYYCVIGKTLHLRVTVTTSGAPTSTNLTITNLPGSFVADETAMLDPTTGSTLGMGTIIDSGTTNYGFVMARWAQASDAIPLVVSNGTPGGFQNVTDTYPMTWGASDQLQFVAMVPIQ